MVGATILNRAFISTTCSRTLHRLRETSPGDVDPVAFSEKQSRDFELREIAIREKAAIIKQGALSRNGRNHVADEIRAGLAFLDGIITKAVLPDHVVSDLKKRRDKVEREVSKILKAPARAGALSDISPSKRSAYQQLISLIYECSASQANAKLLVDKILARIS